MAVVSYISYISYISCISYISNNGYGSYAKGRPSDESLPPRLQLFLLHPLLELVDASTGINQFLASSKERMALRADIYIKVRLNGAGLEGLTTGAFNNGLAEFGMNALFHVSHLS